MDSIKLKAYAKLNLTMEVIDKRADNYHNIRSVMDFITLYDEIEITKADSFSFWCDDENLNNSSNLCVRGYNAIKQVCDISPVEIKLYKKVPYQSGMGSGSADCGAVLRGLCQLFNIDESSIPIMEIGASLGADVPACIHGGRLIAEGIGEKITVLDHNNKFYYNVIMPSVAFSTVDMYNKIDSCGDYSTYDLHQQMLDSLSGYDVAGITDALYNDFTPVAEPQDVITQATKALFESGAVGVSMTGAGSAVFGIYSDKQSCEAGWEILKSTQEKVYNCHSV